MAAGEHQSQTVVRYVVRIAVGWLLRQAYFGCIRLELFSKSRPSSNAIDRFVTRRLYDPRAGKLGNAVHRPLVDGDGKSLLSRFFSDVEVSGDADQCRNDPAPVR